MVLKMTYQNAEALFNLFTTSVITRISAELDEQLVMLHMVAIYKKLRNKYEGLPRKTYNLSVTLAEAIAYRIYWRDCQYEIGNYEWVLILDHMITIERELVNYTLHQKQATKFLNQ